MGKGPKWIEASSGENNRSCEEGRPLINSCPKSKSSLSNKLLASLTTQSVKGGESIPPEKRRLADNKDVECTKCGDRFVPDFGSLRQ
jgi:hypothetical protein